MLLVDVLERLLTKSIRLYSCNAAACRLCIWQKVM